jgi:predicted esterase
MHTTNPIGAIICHNGAIFEPNKVPVCKNTNPFYVTHGLNDDCFDWVERYLPMKESLIQNNYNVDFLENDGYHIVAPSDVKLVNQYLCKYFAT